MESGGVLGFLEPESEGLSPEEKDNLLRSTKKPKVHERVRKLSSVWSPKRWRRL
ncbi:hypothetical protein SESBI_25967 [Sesbania bispinosa]|nr:hypothetical protein SESBI_25967 [Sesbania bispinosa]